MVVMVMVVVVRHRHRQSRWVAASPQVAVVPSGADAAGQHSTASDGSLREGRQLGWALRLSFRLFACNRSPEHRKTNTGLAILAVCLACIHIHMESEAEKKRRRLEAWRSKKEAAAEQQQGGDADSFKPPARGKPEGPPDGGETLGKPSVFGEDAEDAGVAKRKAPAGAAAAAEAEADPLDAFMEQLVAPEAMDVDGVKVGVGGEGGGERRRERESQRD